MTRRRRERRLVVIAADDIAAPATPDRWMCDPGDKEM